MGKTKYNKETKMYERTILVNGVSAICIFPIKKHLDELPYRIKSKQKVKKEQ